MAIQQADKNFLDDVYDTLMKIHSTKLEILQNTKMFM